MATIDRRLVSGSFAAPLIASAGRSRRCIACAPFAMPRACMVRVLPIRRSAVPASAGDKGCRGSDGRPGSWPDSRFWQRPLFSISSFCLKPTTSSVSDIQHGLSHLALSLHHARGRGVGGGQCRSLGCKDLCRRCGCPARALLPRCCPATCSLSLFYLSHVMAQARPARCSGAPCGARPSPSSYADNGTSHEPYLKRGVPAAVEGDHRPLGWWAPFKRLPSPCPGRLRAWGRGHRLLGLDTPWAPCPGLAAVEAVWGCPPQGASGFPSIRSTAMQGRGQRRPAGGDFPGGRERRAARPGPSPAV